MTRSLSKSGLLKSNWVYVNPTETRVIDTNAMVESKLKELSEKLSAQTRTMTNSQMALHRELMPNRSQSL